MCITVVANDVMLQLYIRHGFYNLILKSNIIYIYSLRVRSLLPLHKEKFWVRILSLLFTYKHFRQLLTISCIIYTSLSRSNMLRF
jgi:hypothetical protein